MNVNAFLEDVRKTYPSLHWKSADIINHGYDHVIIILDDELVLRFPRTNEYLKSFRSEVEFLSKHGSNLSLSVPAYHLIPKHKRFAGYRKIEGVPLSPWRYARKLSKVEKKQCVQKLGSFLRSLHNMPVPKYLRMQNLKSELQQCRKLYKKFVQSLLDTQSNRLLSDALDSYEQMLMHLPASTVTHGDLYWRHLLWDTEKNSLSGVIDFGDIAIDDPAIDFAYCHHFGDKFLESLFKVYGADDAFRNRVFLHTFFRCFRTLCFAAKAGDNRVPFSLREMKEILEKFSKGKKR